MAADSVAVQMPNRMTTRTTTVSTPRGTTETINSFRISSCSPFIRQKYQSSSAPQTATEPQNHWSKWAGICPPPVVAALVAEASVVGDVAVVEVAAGGDAGFADGGIPSGAGTTLAALAGPA